MKKFMSVLLAASISVSLLAGCSSSKTASSTDSSKATSSSTNKTHKKFNPSAMKTRYETVLKELVADKTITQDQSDKIIAEISKQAANIPQNKGGKKNWQNNKQGGNGQHRNGGNRGNQLSSLVSSGVITQAQADTITQKLKESNTK